MGLTMAANYMTVTALKQFVYIQLGLAAMAAEQ